MTAKVICFPSPPAWDRECRRRAVDESRARIDWNNPEAMMDLLSELVLELVSLTGAMDTRNGEVLSALFPVVARRVQEMSVSMETPPAGHRWNA